jgi:hypothetical protein
MTNTKLNHRKIIADTLKRLSQVESSVMNIENNPNTFHVLDDPTNPYAFRVQVPDGDRTREFRVIVKEID